MSTSQNLQTLTLLPLQSACLSTLKVHAGLSLEHFLKHNTLDSEQETYFLCLCCCWAVEERMVSYQPLSTKKATMWKNPVVMTSRTARGNECWGDIPAPTTLSMSPSKLQLMLKCPAFRPCSVLLATDIESNNFDDVESFFVSSGLVFSSANNNNTHHSSSRKPKPSLHEIVRINPTITLRMFCILCFCGSSRSNRKTQSWCQLVHQETKPNILCTCKIIVSGCCCTPLHIATWGIICTRKFTREETNMPPSSPRFLFSSWQKNQ